MSTPNDQDREPAISPANNIVLIVAGGPLANIVINHLARRFQNLFVLQEEPERKLAILRRRSRMLGPVQAVGQAAAGVLQKVVLRKSQSRIDQICNEHQLDHGHNQPVSIHSIGSVNSEACRQALQQFNPAVVAVYGTRIIGKRTLNCIPAPFINYHAGINPKYRGQHPAYWALVEADQDNAGVTIHLVDDGVDTGDVLRQQQVVFDPRDNITSYQFVQMATALPLFASALDDALAGKLLPRRVDLPSRQWFPPTIWTYLWNGLTKGVW